MGFNQPTQPFETRYNKERNVRAKTRLHVLLLCKRKYTQREIAAIIHVTQGTVSNICQRFLTEGWVSVYDKPRTGRPSRLSYSQKKKLCAALQQEFIDGEIRRWWQTKDVMTLVKEKFNVKYSQRKVRGLLHELKMSWNVPRLEHKNKDENDARTFKKTSPGRVCLWHPIAKSSA